MTADMQKRLLAIDYTPFNQQGQYIKDSKWYISSELIIYRE